MVDSKSNHGLSTIGVGSVACAWHNFKFPNGVVDLQIEFKSPVAKLSKNRQLDWTEHSCNQTAVAGLGVL